MNSVTSAFFTDTATTRGMPNTKRRVSITTDRMLEEPCEATSLMHGFEAERRGRPLRLGNHLDILKQGVDIWNKWRQDHPDLQPDLSDVFLPKADLHQFILTNTNLFRAYLIGADLHTVLLNVANLGGADLRGANLRGANLTGAYIGGANLSEADLSGAMLNKSHLIETNLMKANLTGCAIYGISAWDLKLEGAIQSNLVITSEAMDGQPSIAVDNLEVAQFIYLIMNNKKIRDIIDTITLKVVLILGRFTPGRKALLDRLKDELRKRDYSPVLFDFEKPSNRNITETVSTLAHLSRFIIADITDPSSIPQELYAIVPTLAIPVQPLLEASNRAYSMFDDLKRTYHWVLPVYQYTDFVSLLPVLEKNVIAPAERKAQELAQR